MSNKKETSPRTLLLLKVEAEVKRLRDKVDPNPREAGDEVREHVEKANEHERLIEGAFSLSNEIKNLVTYEVTPRLVAMSHVYLKSAFNAKSQTLLKNSVIEARDEIETMKNSALEIVDLMLVWERMIVSLSMLSEEDYELFDTRRHGDKSRDEINETINSEAQEAIELFKDFFGSD